MIHEIERLDKAFRPFPAGIDADTHQHFIADAEQALDAEWPPLPATLYLDFYRNGKRSPFEQRYFERRSRLLLFLIAECLEGKGRFIDNIINGLWCICEESTWVVPAHNNWEIADIEADAYIDLFAAETGALLSWVYYFLGDALALQSPLVKRRIAVEVERRILKPFLAHDDFPWMGLEDKSRPVNNWNPWINSNLLPAFLVFAPENLLAGVNKTIRSINRFIDSYAEDGGCDEGPSYFEAAGAALFDFIEVLGQVSDVEYLYKTPKIQNMASYIYKVYIGEDYYVNFADAPPHVPIPSMLLRRFAQHAGDRILKRFADYIESQHWAAEQMSISHNGFHSYRFLMNLCSRPGTDAPRPGIETAFTPPLCTYFKGIEVLAAHQGNAFFAVKGGHNDESHSHNDVGNFIFYHNNKPLIIDAGVETYTKSTFNDQRYTLWTMQSCYHNCPTINGFDQKNGREFAAQQVEYREEGRTIHFQLDLAAAYPPEAAVRSYRRRMTFDETGRLTLCDHFILDEWKAPLVLNFLFYDKPKGFGKTSNLVGFECSVDEIALKDPKIHNDWRKDYLYRLRLTKPGRETEGTIELTIGGDGE